MISKIKKSLLYDYFSIVIIYKEKKYIFHISKGFYLFVIFIFSFLVLYGIYSEYVLPELRERSAVLADETYSKRIKIKEINELLPEKKENAVLLRKFTENIYSILEIHEGEYEEDKNLLKTTKDLTVLYEKLNMVLEENERLPILTMIPHGNPAVGGFISGFGYRMDPFLGWSQHTGVDIENRYGTKTFATTSGRVIHAGWGSGIYGGYGISVVVDNGFFKILYGHLMRVNVKYGDKVHRGQLIGLMGSTGLSTGSHLHYEVRTGYDYPRLNPVEFMDCMPRQWCGR